ncbi:mitochondrial ribosomal protein subunit L20-domain-containing protein [Gongronella butleri]|nr:mitochondrial ribosomal protein subunit L20-domain-containing protein [Gongronella butleri]
MTMFLRQLSGQVRQYATKSKAPNRKMTARVPIEQVKLADGSTFITRQAVVPVSVQASSAPVLHRPATTSYAQLTDAQISELRALREQDPRTWSRKKLAEKFNCSPLFVSMIAPSPRTATPPATQSPTAGYRRQLITKNRQRRKDLW